jgi:hypothetical protein
MTERILTKLLESSNNKQKTLRFFTAQAMINKFLSCDRLVTSEIRCKKYTAQELANKLSISLPELEPFTKPPSRFCHRRNVGKIDMALIKMYCNTKWADF